MHNEENNNISEKVEIESTDNALIRKLKSLKERKNQKIVVEVLVFVSIVLSNYYLFAVAMLSWFAYLMIGMPYYWKESKLVFFAYLIISIIVIYLLVASISGIIKFWKFKRVLPILWDI